VYKDYLLKFLFPAIKEKWPRKDKHQLIVVQQDNAKPHLSPTDPDIVAAGVEDGWNIRLVFQPPNSPDINVLDLGLFASLQSIQYRKKMGGIEDIVNAVGDAYAEMTCDKLNDIFCHCRIACGVLSRLKGVTNTRSHTWERVNYAGRGCFRNRWLARHPFVLMQLICSRMQDAAASSFSHNRYGFRYFAPPSINPRPT
jgi:hypothetical protein